MKTYLCIEGCLNGPFTKGNYYKIKKDKRRNHKEMYLLYYYDDNLEKPGSLNDFWFHRGFREIIELNNNIKIL